MYIIIHKRPNMYIYSKNLEIMFFFPSSCCPSSPLPWTLDAKSLGHGLTRSRCVHVHPTVSNCQTTTPPPPQQQPRDMCLSYVGKAHAVLRLEKSMYDQQERCVFHYWCLQGPVSYYIIFFCTIHANHNTLTRTLVYHKNIIQNWTYFYMYTLNLRFCHFCSDNNIFLLCILYYLTRAYIMIW